jgi:predicted aminopeptidase
VAPGTSALRSSSPLAPAANASAAAQPAASPPAARTRIRSKARASLVARLAVPALLLAAPGTTGCYYAHLASGQARVLLARQPIEELLAAPGTPADLAERLRVTGSVRAFAARLGLEVGQQYTSFVDWPGDRVVTTVVATRPGEIDARGFWFPLVGRMPYKGFFALDRAQREAQRLAEQGLDTCLFPVVAYSTLGWLADPLTAPLARSPRLVETLLHELLHATVFVRDQVAFDEGVATFVGQEGAVRFAAEAGGAEAAARERRRVEEDRRVGAELQALRERVAGLYAAQPAGPARDAERLALELEARRHLAALPLETRDAGRLAEAARLNDACQALVGTYHADLPRYAEQLARLGGDLGGFVARAREAAGAPDPRAALLAAR